MLGFNQKTFWLRGPVCNLVWLCRSAAPEQPCLRRAIRNALKQLMETLLAQSKQPHGSIGASWGNINPSPPCAPHSPGFLGWFCPNTHDSWSFGKNFNKELYHLSIPLNTSCWSQWFVGHLTVCCVTSWTLDKVSSWILIMFFSPWARRHWFVHLVYLVFLAICDTVQQFPSKKVSCK